MTMQGKKRATVEVTVTSHKQWKGKPAIDLNVTEWPSDYPTTLYNVTDEAKQALYVPFQGKVVLEGTLKAGKDAEKPWNFFWDFVELAQGGEYPYPIPPTNDEPEQPPDELFGEPNTSNNATLPTKREEITFPNAVASDEQKNRNIHASVAYDFAERNTQVGTDVDTISADAFKIYKALRYMSSLSGLEEGEE